MLTIRLQRTGKRNNSDFRVILAEKTAAAGKKFVEILGSYNPRTKHFVVKDEQRLSYWLSQHVEVSPTVHNLFVSKDILKDSKKVKAFSVPKKPVEEANTVAPAAATPASEEVSAETTEAAVAESTEETAV
jgi:small subunit ribosomal protein S16